MDSVRRRRCETCGFHQAGPTPCTGICHNWKWQPRSDAIRFVRDRELACYQGWGVDFWRPKNGSGPGGGPTGVSSGPGGSSPAGGSYGSMVGAPLDPVPSWDAGETDRIETIVWHADPDSP